jgi:hypothetical protein
MERRLRNRRNKAKSQKELGIKETNEKLEEELAPKIDELKK